MDMSDLSFPLSFSPEIRKLQKMAGASIPGMREILGAAERCSEGGFIPGELGVVSNVIPYSHPFHQTPLLPVAIDYPAALALRQMALVQDDLPKYLLAPEVSALLHYVPDLHHKMLLATLWNTGARINEALALTRGIFRWPRPTPLCSWPRSSSVQKEPQERPDEIRLAVRFTAWFLCQIRSTSASCR